MAGGLQSESIMRWTKQDSYFKHFLSSHIHAQAAAHGGSYKQMFFERNLQDAVEQWVWQHFLVSH